MALGVNSTDRTAWCQEIIDSIDAGAGAGLLRFYDGTRPATGGTATTLLATVTCSDPCGTASNGVLTFSSFTDDTNAAATGTATWARFVDSTGTFVLDCSVTATSGGGDIELSSTSITAGGIVSVTSGTITAGNA